MKKTLFLTVSALVLIGVGLGVYTTQQKRSGEVPLNSVTNANKNIQEKGTSSDSSSNSAAWKTYRNEKLGFQIQYPNIYVVTENPVFATTVDDPRWKEMDFLSIIDPGDTSNYEFHVIPAHIVLERQPLTATGPVYKSVDELVQNGVLGLPKGASVLTINGRKVAYAHSQPGTAEDAPSDMYVFMQNKLLYFVFINTQNPYAKQMLDSINFDTSPQIH